jgi:hypothetical protein
MEWPTKRPRNNEASLSEAPEGTAAKPRKSSVTGSQFSVLAGARRAVILGSGITVLTRTWMSRRERNGASGVALAQ